MYIAGSNNPGYLPQNVEEFDDFDDAKRYIIDEMLFDADNFAEGGDEDKAEDISNAAEDVNLESGPFEILTSGIVWWVVEE